MKKIIPLEKKIKTTIEAPPSKSHTLRAFFIASLAQGKSVLKNPLLAQDQKYAMEALKNFNVDFKVKEKEVIVNSKELKTLKDKVFIGNSGVTARFLASLAALSDKGVIIDGTERMRKGRPIKELIQGLKKLGVKIESQNNCLPIKVKGNTFEGGVTELKGEISSQYFSSILISAPYAKKDVTIKCIGKMSSKPYIDITIQTMKDFGVKVKNNNYQEFYIKSNQKYQPRDYQIEGDYSNASYFLAAVAINKGKITIKNLKRDSTQGDKVFLDCLEKMGCQVVKKKNEVTLTSNKELKSIGKIDMNSYPDLVPTLAVVSVFAQGKTEIVNIGHLRFKECDRIKALAQELKKVGAKIEEKKDSLVIFKSELYGSKIKCYNDHRIAMAFSVLGLKIPGIVIEDEKCVGKSFNNFYQVFEKIYEK